MVRAFDSLRPHLKSAETLRAAAVRGAQLRSMRFSAAPPPPLSAAPPDPREYERRKDDGLVWAPELYFPESLPEGLPCAHCSSVGLQLTAPSSPPRPC